jgi:hypothetical protein
MIFIITYVGRFFFTNGRIFIISLLNGNVTLADRVNKILLLAYYLFNVGYTLQILNHWQLVSNLEMLLATLIGNVAVLILILAVTHYFNMLVIYFLSKSKSFSITNKTFQL